MNPISFLQRGARAAPVAGRLADPRPARLRGEGNLTARVVVATEIGEALAARLEGLLPVGVGIVSLGGGFMSTHPWRKCAAAVAIVTLVMGAEAAAQTAAADPWKRVPAAPTSCYPDDDFGDKVTKASADLEAEIARQVKLNGEIQATFDAMDMSEKARRMQAFMMKNPQEAMRIMQAERAAGTAATSSMMASNADASSLDDEFARLTADFNAAVDKAVKPIKARQQEMLKTRTRRTEAESEWLTPADKAQYATLVQQENAEYEKVCATYFAPGGPFPVWLRSYQAKVIEPGIMVAEASEGAVVLQMKVMDTPTGAYRSTATLEGVRDYLRRLDAAYGLRHHKARAE